MAERLEVYKCELCGNIVQVMHGGAGELVCCGQPMVLQKANTVESIVKITTEGKDKMPAYKDKLSDEEMKAIAEYILTLK